MKSKSSEVKKKFYEIIVGIAKFLLTNNIDTNLKSSSPPGQILNWFNYYKKYSLLDYIFYEYEKQSYNDYPSLNSESNICRNKQQYCDKLIQLFLTYGCEYSSYLKKFNNNHLKIIKTIEFSKNYFKTINDELKNIQTEFVYKPGGIRSNVFKIHWEYHNGLNYSDIKKSNQNVFDYFGINDQEKLIQIIDSV